MPCGGCSAPRWWSSASSATDEGKALHGDCGNIGHVRGIVQHCPPLPGAVAAAWPLRAG
ncbi:hypothetical protein [Streptomyces sp. WM6378]|uniref:hypothetical protein n=1 Tax=Streptomyces sp. WM6378 TaxID=1415557 RepID=UPI00131E2679|nr:hypothetical protein [Streptomyces sp. WM6378]